MSIFSGWISMLPGASVSGGRAYVEAGLSFSRNVSLQRLDTNTGYDNVLYLGGGLTF